jgi:hypothetical protein
MNGQINEDIQTQDVQMSELRIVYFST